ncbi:MAG: hypothetical protein V4539_07560 [Bacteroidota bacterium]
MRKLYFLSMLACTCLSALKLTAQQPAKDSSIRAAAINNAILQYQDYISFAAPLYAGPQYTDYYLKLQEGHPFYLNTFFHVGSIMYDHILYERIPMKYDILQNRIVIEDASGVFRLLPEYDKISYFTIQDHEFIKLIKDSSSPTLPKSGFYEVLYKNKNLTLLKKETKEVVEDLNSRSTIQRNVITNINFYLRAGNSYRIFNKKKHVLALFKDKKTEIRQYIRKKNLDFNIDADNALISVVSYYQELTK